MSRETNKHNTDMSEKVLERIAREDVTMHSRTYFVVRTALWILGMILLFALTLYLMSFIEFIFRGNALLELPHLGRPGWLILLTSLPWFLVIAVAGIFVVLQLLSLHFSFVYKRPLVHTTLASIVILIAGTTLIAHTTLHERVYELNRERGVPIAGPLYRASIGDRDDRHIGIFTTINERTFILQTRSGDVYTVHIATSTRMPRMEHIATGTPVMVIGDNDGDEITAFGIRPLDHCPVSSHCGAVKPPVKD